MEIGDSTKREGNLEIKKQIVLAPGVIRFSH